MEPLDLNCDWFIRNELAHIAELEQSIARNEGLLATLLADRDAVSQEIARNTPSQSAQAEFRARETRLTDRISEIREAMEAAAVAFDSNSGISPDPELRRLQARLAYCEVLFEAGDRSQRRLILQFTAQARARYLEVRNQHIQAQAGSLFALEQELASLRSQSEGSAQEQSDRSRKRDLISKTHAETQAELIRLRAEAAEMRQTVQARTLSIRATQQEIIEAASRRNVRMLVHFTPIQNLKSILSKGLLSRSSLKQAGLNAVCTDQLRRDGHLDRISVSISFPNYLMLYTKTGGLATDHLCILQIEPRALWERDCLFSASNAALSSQRERLSGSGWDSAALERMFADPTSQTNPNGIRAQRGLPDNFPTDPQAEVLVARDIPRDWIQAIHVRTSASQQALQEGLAAISAAPPIRLTPALFAKRIDSAYYVNS